MLVLLLQLHPNGTIAYGKLGHHFYESSYQMNLVNIIKCLVQGTCQPGPKGEKGDQGPPGMPAESRESDFRLNIGEKKKKSNRPEI